MLIRLQGKNFLIDAGPDFRAQALAHGLTRLDGVLLTHSHFDHIGGLDDLRPYYFFQKKRVPCLLSKETFEEIKIRYNYLMEPLSEGQTISAQLDFIVLEEDVGQVVFEDVSWSYVSYHQAGVKVNGFRTGKMAYISDIRTYPESIFDSLQGLDLLVLSAFRTTVTQMHFSVDEAIEFSSRTGAKKTYLTHIGHDLEHEEASKLLPENVHFAYDGLSLSF